MSVEIVSQTAGVITSNTATLPAATATQISGSPSGASGTVKDSSRILSAVSATFIPNFWRASLRLTNLTNQPIYLGSTNSVTASTGWHTLIPVGGTILMNCRGTMKIFAFSTPGGSLEVEELV